MKYFCIFNSCVRNLRDLMTISKIIFLIITLFSLGISQEYYYYGHCAYDTIFVKKDIVSGIDTIIGRCCMEECTKEIRNRKELEVYGDDLYIRTKDCEAIIRKINSAMPIFAEYCLQEDKLDLRLVKILDTITKIYPYEYEEIRECSWNVSKFCSIGIPTNDGIGPFLSCGTENGYILFPEMKKKINKVKEYHSFFKEKFYVGIPYADYLPKIDRKELESYKNLDGTLTIEWSIYGSCPPKEGKNKHFFTGSYKIRITGECKDM